MNIRKVVLFPIIVLLWTGSVLAQGGIVKVKLVDSLTQSPVEFASVYLSADGSVKGALYSMTDTQGYAEITKVRKGKYIFKAELMGYKVKSQKVDMKGGTLDLGTILLQQGVR